MSDLKEILGEVLVEQAVAAASHEAMAKKALAEGDDKLAALFAAQAEAQRVQSRRLIWLMRGKIGPSSDNAEKSFGEELDGKLSLLAAKQVAAEEAGQKTAAALLDQIRRVEERTREVWGDISSLVNSDIYVCGVCGYASPDRAPLNCPVCTAVPQKFSLAKP